MTSAEQNDMVGLLNKCKMYLDEKFCLGGYNVGVNCGEVIDQNVMYVYMHLILRYKDDVESLRGGER